MNTYNFTNGKKEIKSYREISNKKQHIFSENEVIQVFKTDNINKMKNKNWDTRFEEIK
jgi:hypothetical protein